MLKAIHAQENAAAARQKAQAVIARIREMKLTRAAEVIESGIEETLRYHHFPAEHHIHLRTNNPLERIMREIRRRNRVAGCFPDGNSALMLVCARLRHSSFTKWGTRRRMDMSRLREADLAQPQEQAPF